ncbi:hypothetical protein EYC80_001820 [Monilinia laxa]|uniref:Uncharacterized protein n=1 Tax=Monilinia laxa TaxID=61186 RepID=A0A5N6K652_MONLA|nr:hypothetical protein EYC80_001820 [Monilinia laxa]
MYEINELLKFSDNSTEQFKSVFLSRITSSYSHSTSKKYLPLPAQNPITTGSNIQDLHCLDTDLDSLHSF